MDNDESSVENIVSDDVDETDSTRVADFESFSQAVESYRDTMTDSYHELTLPPENTDPKPKEYPERERDIVSGHQFLVSADFTYGIAQAEYYLGNTYSAEDWFETSIDHYLDATTFMFEKPFYAEDGIDVYALSHPNIGGHCETIITKNGIARYGTRPETESDDGYNPEIGTPDHKIDVLYRCMGIAKIIGDDDRASEAATRLDETYIAAHEAGEPGNVHVWPTAGLKRGIAGLINNDSEPIEKTSIALNNISRNVELPSDLDLHLQLADGFANKSSPLIRNGIELVLHRHVALNAGVPIHIPSRLCCLEGTLLSIVASEQGYDVRDGNQEYLTSFEHSNN